MRAPLSLRIAFVVALALVIARAVWGKRARML